MIADITLSCTGMGSHDSIQFDQLRSVKGSDLPSLMAAFGAVEKAQAAKHEGQRRPVKARTSRARRTGEFPSDERLSVRFTPTKAGGFWQFGCPKCHPGRRDAGPRISTRDLARLLDTVAQMNSDTPGIAALLDVSRWPR